MNKIKHIVIKVLRMCFENIYHFRKRLFLKNKNFTILCNNCIGGCIYHILKKEFLSPTINLYMKTEDFIKFLSNLDFYIKSDLQQVPTKHSFPVGEISGLKLFFNHSPNFDTAKFDWEKRKNRIIKNNTYVIIREIDFDKVVPSETIDFLMSLYKNVVIITFNPERRRLPHYQYIDIKGKDEFQKNWFGIDLWDRKWNWARFINKVGKTNE